MKITLEKLLLVARSANVEINFAKSITFLHGPIGKGKSSVARLVNYCLGGEIERTPALQREFVSTTLFLRLGNHQCSIERGAEDTQSVRVTWFDAEGDSNSVNAPFLAQTSPLIDGKEVFNLSDLIFFLCDVTPIKVRKTARDPDSPMIRLSFRDIWRYCYLDQAHLDSSFFRLEDPNRWRKSQDAMRFFTGLYSERLSQLESELMKTIDEQKGKREAVKQIRAFIERFEIESDESLANQILIAQDELNKATVRREQLQASRNANLHPSDELREKLRRLGGVIGDLREAIAESYETIREQTALKSEFVTAKTKALRAESAGEILEGVDFLRCPQCGKDISHRPHSDEVCGLCGTLEIEVTATPVDIEVQRRDINERIDQLNDAIARRGLELKRMQRQLARTEEEKKGLDDQLQDELKRYDSAFVESIRTVEREIATMTERIAALKRLQRMPEAINELEEEAGALQGKIENYRTLLHEEKVRLQNADANISVISSEFKRIMLAVSFPGFSEEDEIVLDPRNWKPTVVHDDQEWGFWDTGSGGKKTLFNVCYGLAIHSAALLARMPVPSLLVIDTPTKNISDYEDPVLVRSLYDEIYRLANQFFEDGLQFLIIDSDLVDPTIKLTDFSEKRMAGEPDAPSLIPYYDGP
jgi:rubrerythrin